MPSVPPAATASAAPLADIPAHAAHAARRRTLAAEAVLLLVVLAWGVNPPIIKAGLAFVAPQPYNLARFVVASAVALLALALSRTWRTPDRRDLWALFRASALGFFLFQFFFTEGIQRTTAGNASFVLCLMPFSVILLNRCFRLETITRPVVVGILCSMGGVLLIVQGTGSGLRLGSEHLHGSLMLLVAQFGYAYYTVFTRDLRERYSTYQVTATLMVFTTLLLTVAALPGALAVPWTALPAVAWGSILFSGIVGLCVATFAYLWCVGVVGSARAAIYNNLCPVVTVAAAYFMLGERFGALQSVGAAFVLAGVYVTRLRGRNEGGA